MRKIFQIAALLLIANTAFAQDFRYPRIKMGIVSSGGGGVFTINQTTDRFEYITQVPEATTVTKIEFGHSTRTGTPVAHKIGIQGVDTSNGHCNGTYLTGTGECSASFTPPASSAWNDTIQTVTLTGTTCALTRGQNICIKLEPTGTPDGSNNSSFYYSQSTNGTDSNNSEFAWTVDNSVFTRRADFPLIGYGNGSRMFGYPYFYAQNFYDSTTNPNEYALRLNYPCPTGNTFKIAGLEAIMKLPPTSTSITIRLYSGTTVLQDKNYDADYFGDAVGSVGSARMFFDESSLTSLTCGSVYYLAVAPQNGMSFFIPTANFNANADLDSLWLGPNAYLGTRNGGSWTDVTTKRPAISPIIDSQTAVAGGIKNQNQTSGGTQ